MSKMIFAFLAIFGAVFLGIQGFIATSGREKLQLAKVLGYSLACATLALLFVACIVILF
jgi:branched-subunit amino acid transport protein AzlD